MKFIQFLNKLQTFCKMCCISLRNPLDPIAAVVYIFVLKMSQLTLIAFLLIFFFVWSKNAQFTCSLKKTYA